MHVSMTKRAVRVAVGVLLVFSCVLCFAETEAELSPRARQRLEDFSFLVETLPKSHPNLYGREGEASFTAKAEEIRRAIAADEMGDADYVMALQTYVALARDSHTTLDTRSVITKDTPMLPFSVAQYEEGWIVNALPVGNEAYLGWRAVSLAGMPIEALREAIAPFCSYDNDVRLDRRFAQYVAYVPVLAHFGVVSADATSVPLVVESLTGGERATVEIAVRAQSSKDFAVCQLKRDVQTKPETSYIRASKYFWKNLSADTAYVQYNQCAPDPSYPMDTMTKELCEALASPSIRRVLLDLRNNSGGSDGVIRPLLPVLEGFIKAGGRCYVLLGEATFSSAVINAVMLREIGCVWAGTPSSGNANHYGAVRSFTLPNSKIEVDYSTKYINLADYFNGSYGDSPLVPEILVEQRLADYLNGKDRLVDYLMSLEP